MAPSCCGSGSGCSCKITAGTGMEVSGSGTALDPFVLDAAVRIESFDTNEFDVTVSGLGTAGNPVQIWVLYADSATLQAIPNVDAATPFNGQVLAWNSATQKWVAQNPTTAPVGSVSHNQSLSGDGSVGTPLAVVPDAARGLALRGAQGIGLSDAALNTTVRGFIDWAARAAATPAPDLNTLSMLDTAPGVIEFWDGSSWSPLPPTEGLTVVGGEFMALSGSFSGERTTHLIKQVSGTSDGAGLLEILAPADLASYAGVLSVSFQETGALGFKAVLFADTNRVAAHVFRLTDGAAFPAQAFTGIVDAWVY